jgi:hypothetical protein
MIDIHGIAEVLADGERAPEDGVRSTEYYGVVLS